MNQINLELMSFADEHGDKFLSTDPWVKISSLDGENTTLANALAEKGAPE